jgi:prepilin-type N-terminal cleavage/methylation domain-containing protein
MESVRHLTGFTLAELLIALSILGLIATFTIPKVLVAQQDMTYRANAKDVAAAISAAYDRLRLEGQLSPDTKINDLTPFLNYVSVYTGIMDDTYTDTNINCSNAVFACLKLHNGGTIAYRKDAAFGGTATTNALPIHFDPDGKVTDGTTNGPGKSVSFFLYYNGRIVDRAHVLAGTSNTAATYGAQPNKVPPWFSWD